MKLTIIQDDHVDDEIIIRTSLQSSRLKKLIHYIEQYCITLRAYQEKREYQLSLEDIYYMEALEGETILYTQKDSYTYKDSLSSLEERLEHTSFCRISKQIIVNTAYLKCIEPYANHRLLLILDNDEKLLVNRSYMDALKEKIRE